ncbi:methyltransferase domain-containing protein [Rhodobacteraceae bacterium LMO-12]|nr:methyltransferase domain-containing protein [Rhodobacteraceae bacterium LMO-JJ12]
MKAEAVTASYRRWAPVYDLTFGAVTGAGRRRAGAYLTGRGGAVLEVGVGTGLALGHYGSGVEVTGIDFSNEMLAKAKRRVAEERLTHVKELRQMDAGELDFADASFDSVAAMHVLSVVPDPEGVMAEIARVLRPGGRVVITNHFARPKGPLATLERITAPLENLIGWQSDFQIERVLGTPGLTEVERDKLPPRGLMTWLVLKKDG